MPITPVAPSVGVTRFALMLLVFMYWYGDALKRNSDGVPLNELDYQLILPSRHALHESFDNSCRSSASNAAILTEMCCSSISPFFRVQILLLQGNHTSDQQTWVEQSHQTEKKKTPLVKNKLCHKKERYSLEETILGGL